MNSKSYIIFFLLLAIVMTSANCSADDDNKVSEVATIVNMALGKYYGEKESSVLTKWEASDQGAVLLASSQSSTASYAPPIQSGSQKSLFLFTLNAATSSQETLVGFYPSDLNLEMENGIVKTHLSNTQGGTIKPCMIGKATGKIGTTLDMALEQLYCTMYITLTKGNYSVKSVTLRGNNNEKIAGDVYLNIENWDVSATEENISVNFNTPLDCSVEGQLLSLMVAPVALSSGYTIEIVDAEGEKSTITSNEMLQLEKGNRVYTELTQSAKKTELIFCGDNMVYMIDAEQATRTSYKDAVTWSWDAKTAASTLGIAKSRCIRLDDCKIIDNNKKMLITSSYNWMVLLDVETKGVLFHTTNSPNAHSAEILPNNRIAVATSTGDGVNNNKVQIYDIAKPSQIIYQADLTSAHGVVWNEKTQRLYAVGGNSLQIYELVNWDSSNPSIKLEKMITAPQNSLHDLTLVNANTLCLAGKKVYLYDIGANTFTEVSHFTNSTSLKSVNYNDETNEFWYTDATKAEGDFTWSTQTIHYVNYESTPAEVKTIKVPDINMYKVRVKSW